MVRATRVLHICKFDVQPLPCEFTGGVSGGIAKAEELLDSVRVAGPTVDDAVGHDLPQGDLGRVDLLQVLFQHLKGASGVEEALRDAAGKQWLVQMI